MNVKELQIITVSAAFRTEEDEKALQDLANYCQNMNMRVEIRQINDYIQVTIAGEIQNIHELITYLKELKTNRE